MTVRSGTIISIGTLGVLQANPSVNLLVFAFNPALLLLRNRRFSSLIHDK